MVNKMAIHKTKRLFLIITAFALYIMNADFVKAEVVKSVFIKPNGVYALIFNEKIQKYSLDNEKNFSTEILADIFGDNNQLLIKPLGGNSTNLTVWTPDSTYIYKLSVIGKNTGGNENDDISDLDSPPNPDAINEFDFEIDRPPGV